MRMRGKERRRYKDEHVEQNMLAILPSPEVVDRLARLYFDTFERTYRILHRPTFWSQYANGNYQAWSKPFLAIVLLTLASVSCLSSTELSFIEDNSTARDSAETWVSAVEAWFSRQSQKHVTLETFQVHCLLLLAKRNNVIKRKRSWISSGHVLRIAISSGLHLEPDEINMGGVSIFDQEMRRRIWATIFEWDLDASTTRGVPPIASSLPVTCRAPSNINDDQLRTDSQALPDPRPSSEKTETSFLNASLQSLPLRTKLASILNNSSLHMTFEEVLGHEGQIHHELDKLPAWVKAAREPASASNFHSATFEGALLDIQLRQYIIFLHDRYTRNGPISQQTYSRMASMTAAEKLLDYHHNLASAGKHALSLNGSGLYAGLLTICFNILLETQSLFYPFIAGLHVNSTRRSNHVQKLGGIVTTSCGPSTYHP